MYIGPRASHTSVLIVQIFQLDQVAIIFKRVMTLTQKYLIGQIAYDELCLLNRLDGKG